MIKSKEEMAPVLINFTILCSKHGISPWIESEDFHFIYSYKFNNKLYKGTFFSLFKCPRFNDIKKTIYKKNLVQFWPNGKNFVKNPYVCDLCINCDSLVVHHGKQETEVFCIHSDFIKDELLINII